MIARFAYTVPRLRKCTREDWDKAVAKGEPLSSWQGYRYVGMACLWQLCASFISLAKDSGYLPTETVGRFIYGLAMANILAILIFAWR